MTRRRPRPTILTLVEAGAILGLSASTLRQQARRGTLRAHLVGKTWTVDADELVRYGREHQGRRGRPSTRPSMVGNSVQP